MSRAVRILAAIGAGNALIAALSFGVASAGPQVRDGFAISTQMLGVLLATVPAGLMLGTFALGSAADRFGERRTLVASWTAVTMSLIAASAISWHAWQSEPSAGEMVLLGAVLTVVGIAGSSSHSAGGRAITEAFPAHLHGRVLSIRHTFMPIGGAIGGASIPWVLHTAGFGPLCVFAAVCAALVVLATWGAMPVDTVNRPGETADVSRKGESPLSRLDLWLLVLSCSMFALVQLGLMGFLTVFLVDEAGYSVAAAATVFAVAQLTGAAGRIVFGVVSDRIGRPIDVLLGLAAVGIVLAIATLAVPTRGEAVLLAVLLALFTSWNGVSVAAAARIAPTGRMGATLGMQTTANATMGVIGPIGIGALIATGGWSVVEGVVLAAFAVALGGLVALRGMGSPSAPGPVSSVG